MSTFRKALTAIAVLLVLLTAAPSIFAGDHEKAPIQGAITRAICMEALGGTSGTVATSLQGLLSIQDPKYCTSLTQALIFARKRGMNPATPSC